ncbi:precorrin-6y C5,15-methyltransferase (decarboxylating) subunit CbiE [Azotosporobacter soli]|uniref:precorrin-6y C5,15-methyltransferase (decarboxylating) subunit CbiE n=1 Tax=Azotosporobacter soli TaxID=3055040 RepID=UPI0031FF32FE
MEHKIIVVGIGPGHPDYLIPRAAAAIREASYLVGSQRALDTFAGPDATLRRIDGDLDSLFTDIATALKNSDVVVMVSGDPGFYSLQPALKARFGAEYELKVIPGLSSIQIAFAHHGLVWQDAELLSVHGRELALEKWQYRSGRKVAFLTDATMHAAAIAEHLLAMQWPTDAEVFLGRNLSYEHEEKKCCILQEATKMEGWQHCVMIVIG